jgi:CMP-N-acetylneuraminic acid synthetase
MGCLRCRILASPVEAVSLKISEAAGVVSAVESMRHPWKQFRSRFLRPQGCLRSRIQASPVEGVSLKISEAAGVVSAVESRRHPWKEFR